MNKRLVQEIINLALAEDIGAGDITTSSTVPRGKKGGASVVAKQDMVLAGLDVFKMVFQTLDASIKVTSTFKDGDKVAKGKTIARLNGPLDALLTGERVALNFLQRMSGIATLTSQYAQAVKGTGTKILDTRKTTPGLRVMEKYAVKAGGGENHRFGLYDAVLIKDNHIAAAGGIKKAVAAARKALPHTLMIEVECGTIKEVKEALAARADIIMFDNMDTDAMKEAVGIVGERALTEASGNMTLERIREVADTGVDFISVGALTHSAPAVDISMKVKGKD